MGPDQVADLIDRLVQARICNDRAGVIDTLLNLVHGPRSDSLLVALTLAGMAGDGAELEPGETFYRPRVLHTDADGTQREGTITDLPPYIATFVQMTCAMNNGDKSMARDLFLGFVGTDGGRALQVIIFGLNQFLHELGACSCHNRGLL